MVQCGIAFCAVPTLHFHNGRSILFSHVSSKPKSILRRGKDGQCRNKNNNVKMYQHEAWITTTDRRCASGYEGHYDIDKVRTCADHFHSNFILCDSEGT